MEQTPNPKCSGCKCYWKPDETDIKSSGLYFKVCKKCRENRKQYRQDNKDDIKQYKQENQDKNKQYMKEYHQKNLDKQKEYRQDNKDKFKQYQQDNKDKIKEYRKQYYQDNQCNIKEKQKQYCQDNKDKIKERIKQYRQDNQDNIKEKCKQYNQDNKHKIKQYQKQLYQYIKENNIPRYLCRLQREQIRRCFNNSKLDKSKHSIEYLGCNIEIFLDHINKKIEYFNNFIATDEIMTLNNIHIDHIKPISKFNLDDEEEFLSCCNYTNLQPLLVKDNLEKHNKWSNIDEEYWNENIKDNDDYTEIYLIK